MLTNENIAQPILKFFKLNWVTILLTIAPPILIWQYIQKDKYELTILKKSDISVVSLTDELSKDVELTYRKKPINSLRVAEFSITNSGNKPIRKDDFEKPILINFTGNILGVPEVSNTTNSLMPKISVVSDTSITIDPLLLNSDDSFLIRVKTDSSSQESFKSAEARIAGIKEVIIQNNKKEASTTEIVLMALALSVSMTSGLLTGKKFISGIKIITGFRDLEINLNLNKANIEIQRKDKKSENYKSGLLMKRANIEDLLLKIAEKEYPNQENLNNSNHIITLLYNSGILDNFLRNYLRSVYSTISKELHQIENILSPAQLHELEIAADSAIYHLKDILNKK